MIQDVQIARFRGIHELTVDGLGRVNLIIGKNDCGKTAFMEACKSQTTQKALPIIYMPTRGHAWVE